MYRNSITIIGLLLPFISLCPTCIKCKRLHWDISLIATLCSICQNHGVNHIPQKKKKTYKHTHKKSKMGRISPSSCGSRRTAINWKLVHPKYDTTSANHQGRHCIQWWRARTMRKFYPSSLPTGCATHPQDKGVFSSWKKNLVVTSDVYLTGYRKGFLDTNKKN